MPAYRPIGNVYDRRRREAWLVDQFGSNDERWVWCYHCGQRMMARTPSGGRRWEIDRYPRCGHDGGRYIRGNIVISCKSCNGSRCRKFCRRGNAVPRESRIEVHRL